MSTLRSRALGWKLYTKKKRTAKWLEAGWSNGNLPKPQRSSCTFLLRLQPWHMWHCQQVWTVTLLTVSFPWSACLCYSISSRVYHRPRTEIAQRESIIQFKIDLSHETETVFLLYDITLCVLHVTLRKM